MIVPNNIKHLRQQRKSNIKGEKEKNLMPTHLFLCQLCLNITLAKVKVKSLSHVRLFATPWTVAHQAPPSMGFSRQGYWSELPFPYPGDLPLPQLSHFQFLDLKIVQQKNQMSLLSKVSTVSMQPNVYSLYAAKFSSRGS